MALLIAGLVLFLGIHFVPTIPAWRNAAVTRWGEQRYKGAFSLASGVGLLLIVAGYALSAIARGATRRFTPRAKYDAMSIGGGILLALVFMAAHRVLFGVRVVPFSL